MRMRLIVMLIVLVMVSLGVSVSAQEDIEPVLTLGGYGLVMDMEWSPVDDMLAVSTENGVLLYDGNLEMQAHLVPTAVTPEGQPFVAGGRIAWSPDGRMLAMASGFHRLSGQHGTEAYIWDVVDGAFNQALTLADEQRATIGAWSSDSRVLLMLIGDGQGIREFVVWDFITRDQIHHDIAELGLFDDTEWQWSDDLTRITATTRDEELIFNSTTGELVERLAYAAEEGVTSPDGNGTATRDDGGVLVTQSSGDSFAIAVEGASRFRGIREFSWSPTGEHVVAWGRGINPNLIVADANTGDYVLELIYNQDGIIVDAAFNPSGTRLVVVTVFGELYLYDIPVGRLVAQRWLHGLFTSLSYSPDGSLIAGANASTQNVYIRDATTGAEVRQLLSPNDPMGDAHFVFTVAWSPDGRYLATGSQIGGPVGGIEESQIDFFIWDVETGAIVQRIPALAFGADYISEINWSADSQRLAYTTLSNQTGRSHIGVWDVANETMLFQTTLEGTAWDIALHPDGSVLAFSFYSDELKALVFVDAATGDLLTQAPDNGERLSPIAWHPDGERLAVLAEQDRQFQVEIWSWDGDATRLFSFEGGESTRTTRIIWSPDGERVAFKTYNRETNVESLQVWSVGADNAELQYEFFGDGNLYPSSLFALTWSVDNRIAVSLNRNVATVWAAP